MNKTIAQQLNVTKFPFFINNDNGKEIYCEFSNGDWCKKEYDDKGNLICIENSNGFWEKFEYNDNRTLIYWQTSIGILTDRRPKTTPEYTMEELVNKLGHNFKIKK